jgi:hypothetical protein
MASELRFDRWLDGAGNPKGTILQVVSAFDNTHYVFNAGAANQVTYYNVTGLSVNITPSASTSKFLIMASISGGQPGNAYNGFFRLARNGTGIGLSDSRGIFVTGGTAMSGWRTVHDTELAHCSLMYVDTPATTSAITYNVQCCNSGGGSYPTEVNRAHTTQTDWPQAGSSCLVVMEIQA